MKNNSRYVYSLSLLAIFIFSRYVSKTKSFHTQLMAGLLNMRKKKSVYENKYGQSFD